MPIDDEFDVAIVGGGPAGAAAALTLVRYTKRRVLVLERGDYTQWRAGETLGPGVTPLLQYLGIDLRESRHVRAFGTAAAWGTEHVVSRDFLFTGRGEGWNLDRRAFDLALADAVVAAGGTLRKNTPVTNRADIPARFIIDASGRHAAIARAHGARPQLDDHLTGLVTLLPRNDDIDQSTLVETVPYGWWYSAPVPDGLVVAVMTDADLIRERHLTDGESWLSALAATTHTSRRAEATPVRRHCAAPTVYPAHSQILDRLHGDDWIAAGEAAVAFDPLSSMGIGYALTSGINAAREADMVLNGHTDHLATYAADVVRHYDAYRARRNAYYAMENRWPNEPFWQRRQNA